MMLLYENDCYNNIELLIWLNDDMAMCYIIECLYNYVGVNRGDVGLISNVPLILSK